jgi:hypothetical protein
MRASVLARQPIVFLPNPNSTVLCNAVPVTVKTSPDDAVLCFTIVDGNNTPLSGTVQGQAVGGVYAGNINFGSLPNGPAYIRVCYAINGSCNNGEQSCVFVPIIIQCSSSEMKAKHAGKTVSHAKNYRKSNRHSGKGDIKTESA